MIQEMMKIEKDKMKRELDMEKLELISGGDGMIEFGRDDDDDDRTEGGATGGW